MLGVAPVRQASTAKMRAAGFHLTRMVFPSLVVMFALVYLNPIRCLLRAFATSLSRGSYRVRKLYYLDRTGGGPRCQWSALPSQGSCYPWVFATNGQRDGRVRVGHLRRTRALTGRVGDRPDGELLRPWSTDWPASSIASWTASGACSATLPATMLLEEDYPGSRRARRVSETCFCCARSNGGRGLWSVEAGRATSCA